MNTRVKIFYNRSLLKLLKEFFDSEKASGFILIASSVISLLLANSYLGVYYCAFWHFNIVGQSLEFWINNALMSVFFLLIGLEIKIELYIGRLSDIRSASLPVFAAIGGMIVPAGIYFLLNRGTTVQAGEGIPMATDIAFALGVLSLLGNRIPVSVKFFLTALAIIDDLGAIVVIVLFYNAAFSILFFSAAIGLLLLLIVLRKLGFKNIWLYLIFGIILWYCMLKSGIHPTISGVLLAFAIPFGNGSKEEASYKLQHLLHKPVAYFILPLFALANTCIVLNSGWQESFLTSSSLGIIFGLLIGKPLGIMLFSYIVVKTGWGKFANNMNWKHLIGVGVLGGIGFTMSIFISLLSFNNGELITQSKLAVLVASAIASIFGLIFLGITTKRSS